MTPNIKTDMTGLAQIYPRDVEAASAWVDKCTYVRFTHSTIERLLSYRAKNYQFILDDLKFCLLLPEF